MRILFATAELSPIATVGGLGAAAAGLTSELRRQGVELHVVMPDYGGVVLADESSSSLDVPSWAAPATLRTGVHAVAGPLHLVSVPGMARAHPYLQPDGHGWPDNAERFFAFSQAVAAIAQDVVPDVVHLNDWHTGTVLAALASPPPSVLSIHNLAYQGQSSGAWLSRLGPRASHYEWYGATNPLTGAIALADAVVAVSPHYADEILTAEGGFGVHQPLAQRGDALRGILNGIDTVVWDPTTDAHLPATFSADDLAGKQVDRAALLDRLGLPNDTVAVAAAVTRLTEQKGIDLLLPLLPLLEQIPLRLAVLGAGDADLAARLRAAADAAPEWFAFVEGYDEPLSHLMFAGADLYLMPSRFEPCGLTQMQAMRYGTIPVVTAVGGLVDTVPDVDREPRTGRGFAARRPEPTDLLAAMFRATRRIADRRRRLTLQRRVMAVDWSWRQPARDYLALYEERA